jgi:threonine dehydrogenase-like Zn-dependent dehydrogenase
MGVSGRDALVVTGLGPVGLHSIVFAKAMGATIVGVDPSAGRRALAEKLGSGELTIFGSSAYPPFMFAEIAELVRRHDLKLDVVVSETFTLEDGPEAFRVAADATTGKVCSSSNSPPYVERQSKLWRRWQATGLPCAVHECVTVRGRRGRLTVR